MSNEKDIAEKFLEAKNDVFDEVWRLKGGY